MFTELIYINRKQDFFMLFLLILFDCYILPYLCINKIYIQRNKNITSQRNNTTTCLQLSKLLSYVNKNRLLYMNVLLRLKNNNHFLSNLIVVYGLELHF